METEEGTDDEDCKGEHRLQVLRSSGLINIKYYSVCCQCERGDTVSLLWTRSLAD